jgi:hypothetical protein
VYNSGPLRNPNSRRQSIHLATVSIAPASGPTVRALSPLP